jgi:transcription termination factor Rho
VDILPRDVARLEDRHLSELHALAAELEIPRFRTLSRADLLSELRARGAAEPDGDGAAPSEAEAGTEEAEGAEAEAEEAAPDREEAAPDREEAPTEPASGVLDIMPQRFGFLRLHGLEPAEGDVYISASQIRRCELRSGDEVSGPARAPRRGERHRALVHVDEVNGAEPSAERPEFESLTAVIPSRRLPLDSAGAGDAELLVRAVDLLVPLALGQRILISAAPRSGRTTLLRALGRAFAADGGVELIVLLVDEHPEEATRWREELPGAGLAIATAEMSLAEQARIAELALARGRRHAEAGRDAVLLVDSLSRLAAGRRDASAVKRLFGSGRELGDEGAGSLTIAATVLDGGDDPAAAVVATTENALITLDPQLAAAGVYPALDPAGCRVSHEEELRSPEELAAIRGLRGLLADLPPADAARTLRERLEASASNAELLASI